MVGPSAIGSENGTPSSITSAPASTSACITGTSASTDGSPAVTNGISALRSVALSWANLVSMRFIALLLPLQGEGSNLPGLAQPYLTTPATRYAVTLHVVTAHHVPHTNR